MSIKKTNGFLIVLLFFVLAATGFSSPTAYASEMDVLALLEERERAVAELMESSTLYVLLDNGDSSFSMGSAFIVAEGYAVTNAHVVGSAKRVLVMNSRLQPVMATVVRKEHDDKTGGNDFALLRFSSATKLSPLTFTLRVNRMDRVSAWGFPVLVTQFDQSFHDILEGKGTKAPPVVYTEGTVSAVVERRGQKTVIHSAAIAGGNSGGPLLNSTGLVIGINSAKAHSGEGLGFAIPINTAKPIVDEIKTKGEFKRSYIGIKGASVSDYLQAYPDAKLGTETGVYIVQIYTDSPAAAAGLRENDIITELEDKKIETMTQLISGLFKYRPGDSVKLSVLRDQRPMTVTVTLISMDETPELPESKQTPQ